MAHTTRPELSWLLSVLEPYRKMPYDVLLALPESSELPGPPESSGFAFRITRVRGERGGVEISAQGWKLRNGQEVWGMCPSFEMLPDGTIAPDPPHDPRD